MSVTEEFLLKAKAQYGSIFMTEVENTTVYYRSMTPNELSSITELERSMKHKDWVAAILSCTVIYPENLEFNLAGSYYVLHQQIMDASLPVDDSGNIKMEEYREWAKNSINSNMAHALVFLIANKYPSTDILKLLETPIDRLMQIAALIEVVTSTSLFNSNSSSSDDPAVLLREQIEREKRKSKQ